MNQRAKWLFVVTIFLAGLFWSCNKDNVNPDIPHVVINLTIDPNSTIFQELNTVDGWLYLDEVSGMYIPLASRGIIVFRSGMYDFKAYERQPPNDPYACCNDNLQNCGKLVIVDYPMVTDTCTGNKYLIYDGNLFEGTGRYPLIEYYAVYDGSLLHIYN